MAQERTVMFQLPSVLSGTLACIAGTVAGRSWELSAGTFVIGRLESSDLHLPSEPGVSKTHAKIVAEGEHYLLIDCESRNGTIVNGAPVQRQILQDGDEVRICGCVLRFAQRGGTGSIKVRNVDARPPEPEAEPLLDDIEVEAPAPSYAQHPSQPPPMPVEPSVALSSMPVIAEPPPPPRGRVLALWYAGGLVGTLLFGGGLSAVLVLRAAPADAQVAQVAQAAPAPPAPAAPGAPTAPATPPAATPPATPAPGATPPAPAAAPPGAPPEPAPAAGAPQPVAAAEKELPAATPPVEEPPAEKLDPTAAEPEEKAAPAPARHAAARHASARHEEAAADEGGGGKAFPASVDGGPRSETVRAKGGGKVKSVEVADGDTVKKGQVLVTFDDGDNADEIATLRDRVASLEGVDEDGARRDLKAAKEKLAALQGKSGGPVLAPMSGKLTGFAVAQGIVVKSGESLGRVVEGGDVPKRVRVSVDRGTRVKRGQQATLVLKHGGEGQGTVSSVSGRSVVVDTGDIAGDEVAAVRF